MLEEMRIRGLGVIADATVPLAPGLTVVTGETGAGKTMVVAGLGLLFGGRADAGRVRTEAGRAVVEGRLRLPADSGALDRALEAGAEVDEDGALLVARSVTAEGRSRAHVGGCAVPVGVLGDLADELLTVHGQADQLRLLRPAEQRAALDRFAGDPVAALLGELAECYHAWQQATREVADRTAHARERAQEAALLEHGLAEIGSVDPQPGEDESLRAESARLEHADALRLAAASAHEALAGDPAEDAPDVATLLGAARRAVEAAEGHDPTLDALAHRVDEVAYLAADLAGDLASYVAALDVDPQRLAAVHERRAAITGLTRRYGETVADVLAWAARARDRLDQLDGSPAALATLTERRDRLATEVGRLAADLSQQRTAAADRFAAAVTAELAALAMPDATVSVAMGRRAPGQGPTVDVGGAPTGVGPDGIDEVELLLAAHGGAPARPLGKAASGGELSRVMLAVEVVFAAGGPGRTMVFDEVDAGVGGRAAVEVGRRLARLARSHQVLAVTHLPQVAAYADTHLVVRKDEAGTVTASGVRAVAGADRGRELARMLAGLDGSELGRAHAEELLATAAADKRGDLSTDRPRRRSGRTAAAAAVPATTVSTAAPARPSRRRQAS